MNDPLEFKLEGPIHIKSRDPFIDYRLVEHYTAQIAAQESFSRIFPGSVS